MNFKDLSIIVHQIKKNIPCPKCQESYSEEDITFIGSLWDEFTFFHAHCFQCEAESIINVNLQMDHQKMVLPKEKEPSKKRLGNAPRKGKVSTNDILDVHNFLQNFDGDFENLFRQEASS